MPHPEGNKSTDTITFLYTSEELVDAFCDELKNCDNFYCATAWASTGTKVYDAFG